MASLWSWEDFLRCVDADFEVTQIPANVVILPQHAQNHMPALDERICSALLHTAELNSPDIAFLGFRRVVERAHGLMPPRVARKKI